MKLLQGFELGSLYQRFVRWAFQRFYHEFAWTYDSVAFLVSGGLWQRWVAASLPFISGRVLELGCGPGHLQQALAAQAKHTTVGLDASPFMLQQAKRRLRRRNLPPLLIQAYAQALPFATASFDSLVATFPADYILDPRTQAEIRRVVRVGGQIVIIPAAQSDEITIYTRIVDLAYWLIWQRPVRADSAAPPEQQPIPFGDMTLESHWVKVGASHVLVLFGIIE